MSQASPGVFEELPGEDTAGVVGLAMPVAGDEALGGMGEVVGEDRQGHLLCAPGLLLVSQTLVPTPCFKQAGSLKLTESRYYYRLSAHLSA